MLSAEEGLSMKTLGRMTAVALLALLIVLPAVSHVNYTASKPAIADGSSLPWPKPPVVNNNAVLTADGEPLPWPKKPIMNNNIVLTADGEPLPWPKKPMVNNNAVLTADGEPLPWPKPPIVRLVA
jgi:hypothetical protein